MTRNRDNMDKGKIQAIPRNGSWEALYERVKKGHGSPVWIELKVTPDLFGNLRNYDLIWEAKQRRFLETEARMDAEGNIRIEECVQQNNGDEDGFGVEPDNYMSGIIGPDGYFIKPLYVV